MAPSNSQKSQNWHLESDSPSANAPDESAPHKAFDGGAQENGVLPWVQESTDLQTSEITQLLALAVVSSPYAIVILDACPNVIFGNKSAIKLLGYEKNLILGKSFLEMLPEKTKTRELERLKAAASEEGAVFPAEEKEMLRADGTTIWVEQSLATVAYAGKSWLIVTMRDRDADRRREMELTRQASSDALTGLANRREFQRQLEQHAEGAVCLAILDLDRFKILNDSCGHPVGDDALQRVAKQICDAFEDSECVGRLGGDEFGVVLQLTEPVEEVRRRFEELRQAVSSQTTGDHRVTLCVGVAVAKQGATPRMLLTQADEMLYRSKAAGRNCVTLTVLDSND